MKLPKYSDKNATSKAGVNYIRTVVETSNSIFHEIQQDNDIGVDAIIEIIKNERPTGKMVAVQIKSGGSFFIGGKCVIPVDNHENYWVNHPLPMFGIAYVPDLDCAYWVDIKNYLSNNKGVSSIKFEPTKANTFDKRDFTRVFVPHLLKEMPRGFTFDEALRLFRSANYDESFLGLIVLFRTYTNRNSVWDEFISYFRQRNVSDIPKIFAYFLAHIPWHHDIWGGSDSITTESREHGRSLIASFGKADVVKLLSLIDEKGIGRGTIGQSVEAIVSSIPQSTAYLADIIRDDELDLRIREYASLIYAYKLRKASLPIIATIATKSDIVALVVKDLQKYGGIALY